MLAHDLQRFSAELLETLGVSGNYRSRVQGRSLVYDEQLLVAQLFFPDKVEPPARACFTQFQRLQQFCEHIGGQAWRHDFDESDSPRGDSVQCIIVR